MADLNLVSFEDFGDLVNRIFMKGLESIPSMMKNAGFVIVDNVPANSGDTRRHKERPHQDEYASDKAEGAQSIAATTQQGYTKDTFNQTVSKNITITLEMRTLGKNKEIIDKLTDLGGMLPNREDLDLSLRFGFATATSYTNNDGRTVDTSTGDALSLANTAHTLTGSATTFRNRVAGNPILSKWALEAVETLGVEQTFNNLGENIHLTYDVLWTTDDPNTVNTAREILQSTADIDSDNAGVINVNKGKYRHMALPRVNMTAAWAKDTTKNKFWGITSNRSSSFFHDVYVPAFLSKPTTWNNGEDILTLDWTYTVAMGYDSAIVEGRWFMFSSGDWVA